MSLTRAVKRAAARARAARDRREGIMREMHVPDDAVFQLLYTGVMASNLGAQHNHAGDERLNDAVALLDAFDGISAERDADPGALALLIHEGLREGVDPKELLAAVEGAAQVMRSSRAMKPGEQTVLLEESVYQMFLRRLRAIPWPPIQARVAQRALKLVADAERVEPKKAPPAESAASQR